MLKYKVVEIFTSIQGEGGQQGTPATFIRLFGCNLECVFCDEPKHVKKGLIKEYTAEELVKLCSTYLVVITGGEPSLNDINPLIEELQKAEHVVQVESNGYSVHNIQSANIKTIAPKTATTEFPGAWDEVKLLIDTDMPIELVKEWVEYWAKYDVGIYLQPINNEDSINQGNLNYTMSLCLEFGIPLSPQLHKLLGVE